MKGFRTVDLHEVDCVISTFARAENVILSPIWAVVSLLIHRRALQAKGSRRPFENMDDFLASRQTKFEGVGADPLFRLGMQGASCMTDRPMTVDSAVDVLLKHSRNVGLHWAGFHRIRHDFATKILTSMRNDTLQRFYTGGVALHNFASIRAARGRDRERSIGGILPHSLVLISA
ncbi:hypothetical protein OC844_007632 [Tilletia horrida]|nr:hypothetical protein OC844_007632 [Tilletia horrida]